MIAPGTGGTGNHRRGVVEAVNDRRPCRAGRCEEVRRGRRGRVRGGGGERVEGESGLCGVEETGDTFQYS